MIMKKTLIALVALLVMSTAAWATSTGISFQVVTAEDLKAEMESGKSKVLVVDARTADEYRRGHLPGAINIPPSKFSQFNGLFAKVYDDSLWGFHEAEQALSLFFTCLHFPKNTKAPGKMGHDSPHPGHLAGTVNLTYRNLYFGCLLHACVGMANSHHAYSRLFFV